MSKKDYWNPTNNKFYKLIDKMRTQLATKPIPPRVSTWTGAATGAGLSSAAGHYMDPDMTPEERIRVGVLGGMWGGFRGSELPYVASRSFKQKADHQHRLREFSRKINKKYRHIFDRIEKGEEIPRFLSRGARRTEEVNRKIFEKGLRDYLKKSLKQVGIGVGGAAIGGAMEGRYSAGKKEQIRDLLKKELAKSEDK